MHDILNLIRTRRALERQVTGIVTRDEKGASEQRKCIAKVYHNEIKMGEKVLSGVLLLVFLDMTHNYE